MTSSDLRYWGPGVRTRPAMLAVVFLGGLGSACASSAGASSGGEPSSPATPPSTPALDCGGPIPGAQPLLRRSSLTILGDYHGTREIPAFVARLACLAASEGIAVSVGFEFLEEEQGVLDEYMAGDGGIESRRRLLAGGYWNVPMQDGRRSRAMAGLLEGLRKLRAEGRSVRAFAFDAAADDRDAAMAANIQARRETSPDDLFLVLVGNVHAARVVGTSWDPAYQPTGVHLVAQDPTIRSINPLITCGTAWNCTGDTPEDISCGPHDIGEGRCDGCGLVRVDLDPAPDGRFDGTFCPGSISASEPAVAAVP